MEIRNKNDLYEFLKADKFALKKTHTNRHSMVTKYGSLKFH